MKTCRKKDLAGVSRTKGRVNFAKEMNSDEKQTGKQVLCFVSFFRISYINGREMLIFKKYSLRSI